MASDDVREVKSRLDIAEVIGDYVVLRKSGQTYWGKCPFHNEKNPLLQRLPRKADISLLWLRQGGDVYTFIMEIENLDFRESLRKTGGESGSQTPGIYRRQPCKLCFQREHIKACAGLLYKVPERCFR